MPDSVTGRSIIAVLAASGLAVLREFGLLLACSVGLAFVAAHLVLRVLPSDSGNSGSANADVGVV